MIGRIILEYYLYYKQFKIDTELYLKLSTWIQSLVDTQCSDPISIYVLEIPHEKIYLLDNDGFDNETDIIEYLKDYIYHYYHTISNRSLVLSVNTVPFDGLDIRHGDILNLLDPILNKPTTILQH
jgi:hypothetical protein